MFVDLLISFLAFVFVLSIVVFIHEFGHYLIAKRNGIKIENFSIGFGKELFGWYDKCGTRWGVSCLPLGGYVKMFGDEDASSSIINKQKLENLNDEEKEKCFYFKSAWVKLKVAFAGPFFNFLLAIFLLTFMYRIYGIIQTKPIVSAVLNNSIAQKNDVRIDDEIIEINGYKITSFSEVQSKVMLFLDSDLNIKIKRNGEIIYKNFKPDVVEKKDILGNVIKTAQIGVVSSHNEHIKLGLFKAFFKSIKTVWDICTSTLISIGQMIVGRRGLDGLGGPIKIAQYSGEYFKNGLESALNFIILISVSLGLMNLLPIPILDGGRILFSIVEIIIRRPLSDKLEDILSKSGFGILILLMIFTTFKDIKDLIFK